MSIEALKSTGSLHAHCQAFIQCSHQHTPLEEVFEIVRDDAQGQDRAPEDHEEGEHGSCC